MNNFAVLIPTRSAASKTNVAKHSTPSAVYLASAVLQETDASRDSATEKMDHVERACQQRVVKTHSRENKNGTCFYQKLI